MFYVSLYNRCPGRYQMMGEAVNAKQTRAIAMLDVAYSDPSSGLPRLLGPSC